jgi:hypothetical protein
MRSPVLRRSLFEGVDDSTKRRMNPTEPVVPARCLNNEGKRFQKGRKIEDIFVQRQLVGLILSIDLYRFRTPRS